MVIHIQQRSLELVASVQEDSIGISFLYFFYVFGNPAVTAFTVVFRDTGASVLTAGKVRMHVVGMQDSTATSFLSFMDWQPELRIKDTAAMEARIKRVENGK